MLPHHWVCLYLGCFVVVVSFFLFFFFFVLFFFFFFFGGGGGGVRTGKPYLRVHILSKFRTRPLAGTASGMASDCPRQIRAHSEQAVIAYACHGHTLQLSTGQKVSS